MTEWYWGLSTFLLLNIIVGFRRVMYGPTQADTMLAAQLFGTTGVAIVLLFAKTLDNPALHDVALVFALLAAVATIAFVSRGWTDDNPEHGVDEYD
ncbi:MAG: monovalent cation/H+ antiporter complex subunit F [Candidatus Binatia bacterium]